MKGKVFIVTGATSGIGLDISKTLLRAGAKVIAFSRNNARYNESLHKWAAENAFEDRVHWYSIDFSRTESLSDFDFASIPIVDGFVNSAGSISLVPLRSSSFKDNQSLLATNLNSPIEFTRLLLKHRKISNDSSLVYLSSINGTVIGTKAHSVYAASKGAIKGFVLALSNELSAKGIRVNAIAPGMVRSEMHQDVTLSISKQNMEMYEKSYPLGIGEVADISGLLMFLLGDSSRWLTGQTIVIDGGVTTT